MNYKLGYQKYPAEMSFNELLFWVEPATFRSWTRQLKNITKLAQAARLCQNPHEPDYCLHCQPTDSAKAVFYFALRPPTDG